MNSEVKSKSSPPYLLGLLGFIPVIGALVGLALILYGAIKYRNKWLVIIGIGCITVTVFVYTALFLYFKFGEIPKQQFLDIAKMQMTSLVKDIEFYKLQHGTYPNNLEELRKENKYALIYDASSGFGAESVLFNYEQIENHYILFSSGHDKLPNTPDDIYPDIPVSDTSKIGLIIRQH